MTGAPVRVLVAAPGVDADHLDRMRAASPRVELVFEPAVPVSELSARLTANAPVEVLLSDGLPDPWQPDGALHWVQTPSAGLDQDVASPVWWNSDVVVTTASGVYGPAISQWVLSVILYHAQRLDQVLTFKHTRRWPTEPMLVGTLVTGQTLGVIGFGSIGRECARLGRAMGMRVLVTRYSDTEREIRAPSERFVPGLLALRAPLAEPVEVLSPDGLDRLLAECDYLVIAAPLTPATRGLIGQRALERMKPSAVLINVSRGGLVDELALAEALRSGGLGGAALDVFAHEPLRPDSSLFDLPNTLLTPHLSGAFHGLWDLVVELFCDNLNRYVAGRPLLNVAQRERGY